MADQKELWSESRWVESMVSLMAASLASRLAAPTGSHSAASWVCWMVELWDLKKVAMTAPCLAVWMADYLGTKRAVWSACHSADLREIHWVAHWAASTDFHSADSMAHLMAGLMGE